jgi:hypothetical protein
MDLDDDEIMVPERQCLRHGAFDGGECPLEFDSVTTVVAVGHAIKLVNARRREGTGKSLLVVGQDVRRNAARKGHRRPTLRSVGDGERDQRWRETGT